jgi:tripartite-type tricarboxylate transporter receptor subunit TctC
MLRVVSVFRALRGILQIQSEEMTMDRNVLAARAGCAAAAILMPLTLAWAAEFPVRPVRIVVPIGPGSSMDITARLLGQKLSDLWERPVVMDNRPGAGSSIGAEAVARAAPDGYTMLFGSGSLVIAPLVHRKPTFDLARDFTAVTQVSERHNVLTVVPSSPVNSVKDLIALARAKPGSQSFGSGGGTGSSDHLVGELLKLLAKIDIVHVPYKSGPQAMNDLLSGSITMYFGGIPVQLPMIRAGKLKPIGTSGAKRSPHLPDVPTVAEAGVPGYEVDIWYGLFVPRATPAEMVSRLAADARRVLLDKANHERFVGLGVDPVGGTPAEFQKLLASDTLKWGRVIKAAGIQAQ